MFDPNFYYPTLITPYKSWGDKQLVTDTHYIFTCTKDNDYFLTLADEVTAYGIISDNFRDAVAQAANRDKDAVNAKDMARLELIGATLNLSNSVTKVANGSFAALASSGMPMRKRPQPIVLGTPNNLVITADDNVVGQLISKISAVKGARSYIVKYTINPQTPDSQWDSIICTTRICIINGLETGAKYWIQVGAVGSYEQTRWGVSQLSPFVP